MADVDRGTYSLWTKIDRGDKLGTYWSSRRKSLYHPEYTYNRDKFPLFVSVMSIFKHEKILCQHTNTASVIKKISPTRMPSITTLLLRKLVAVVACLSEV